MWLHYLVFDPENKIMAQTQLVSRLHFHSPRSARLSKRQTLKDIKDRLYREALSRSTLICLLTSDDSLLGRV